MSYCLLILCQGPVQWFCYQSASLFLFDLQGPRLKKNIYNFLVWPIISLVNRWTKSKFHTWNRGHNKALISAWFWRRTVSWSRRYKMTEYLQHCLSLTETVDFSNPWFNRILNLFIPRLSAWSDHEDMKRKYLRNLLLKPPPAFLTEISFFSFPNEQNPADLCAELVISKWPLKYLVARVSWIFCLELQLLLIMLIMRLNKITLTPSQYFRYFRRSKLQAVKCKRGLFSPLN